MSKVLIIGCGGVASVAIHKCYVDRNPSDHDDSDIDPALCISGADEWGYRKCE